MSLFQVIIQLKLFSIVLGNCVFDISECLEWIFCGYLLGGWTEGKASVVRDRGTAARVFNCDVLVLCSWINITYIYIALWIGKFATTLVNKKLVFL